MTKTQMFASNESQSLVIVPSGQVNESCRKEPTTIFYSTVRVVFRALRDPDLDLRKRSIRTGVNRRPNVSVPQQAEKYGSELHITYLQMAHHKHETRM